MSMFIVDLNKKGLNKFFKDWELLALKVILQSSKNGIGSRVTYERVNQKLDKDRKISRASIINFLNSMVDKGILEFKETTGKGGRRRIYFSEDNEKELTKNLVKSVVVNLYEDFPVETANAIEDIDIVEGKSEFFSERITETIYDYEKLIQIAKNIRTTLEKLGSANLEELYLIIGKYKGLEIKKQELNGILKLLSSDLFNMIQKKDDKYHLLNKPKNR